MKIAFICPENWFLELGQELKNHCEVLINQYSQDCDAVLGMSESQISRIPRVKNLYLYQWDCYDWRGNPAGWVELMKHAKEVWTPSQETADNTRVRYGINAVVVKTFVPRLPDREISRGDYVAQGARDADDIRWDWLERACSDLGLPLKKCHPNKYSVGEYATILAGARCVVSTRREASTGGFCLFEAAYYGKPLLAADCVSTLEYFGDEINYFDKDDFDDFKEKLVGVYHKPHKRYQQAVSYTVDKMAIEIIKRLETTL